MTHDLVVCSLERWDDVWRRNQFLISGLLAEDPALRVLFVEPATDPIFELSQRRRPTRPRGLRPSDGVASGRLWTYHQAKVAPRRVGTFVDHLLVSGVMRAAHRLGFDRPALWINDPAAAPVLVRTGWPALYDITDDWLVADRSPRERAHLQSCEATLMRSCAAVVVCSRRLEQVKKTIRPVTLIPNAVDVARYRTPMARPSDLPVGPGAVYVGTLHEDRLDVELCVQTARRLRDFGTLALVGPNALSPASTAQLVGESNIAILGPRHHETIPAYLQHATALIVPHVVTDFTDSLDPIKLYEYLAVGRPVVSTPVAGFRDFPGPITLARRDEFASAVEKLLSSPPAEPLPTGYQLPTWTARARQMRLVLGEVAPHWQAVAGKD